MLDYNVLLDALIMILSICSKDFIKYICRDEVTLGDLITDTVISAICVILLIIKLTLLVWASQEAGLINLPFCLQ